MIPRELDENLVRQTLRQVKDPELDCNIVDLGLIYGIQIEDSRITVKMSLTSPSCPLQESIAEGVKVALLNLDPVEEAEVIVIWEPPWTPALMNETARAQLGIA